MEVLNCVMGISLKDLDVSPTDRIVLAQLCRHIYKDVSKEYWCNPSYETISTTTGYSPSRLSLAIKKLAEKGYINVVRRQTSSKYIINVPLILEKHQLWKDSFKKDKPKPDTKDYVKTRPMVIEQEPEEEDDDYPY